MINQIERERIVKMEIKNNKKIVYIISAIIIIIGVICTFTMGLKYSLKYADTVRLNIYIGKEYNMEDIKQIAKEVFGKQEIQYQEIEIFKDTVALTLKEATQEQIETLTNKLKEKYEPEAEEVVQKVEIPHQRLKDILKPYIMPIVITTAIILVAVIIMAYISKINILKTVGMLILNLGIAQGVYFSIFAIARIPIGEWFIVGILAIYILVMSCGAKIKLPEKKEKKKK